MIQNRLGSNSYDSEADGAHKEHRDIKQSLETGR